MTFVLITLLAVAIAVLSYAAVKALDEIDILKQRIDALQQANEIKEVKMPKKKSTKKDAA